MPAQPAFACVAVLLLGVAILYVLFWYGAPAPDAPPRCPPPRRRPRRVTFAEPFEEAPPAATAPRTDLQRQALEFSEVLVTDRLREETTAVRADAAQIQTVNERFEEAKRTVVEHRLKPGVYTLKQRRKLVETLLRRPYCGRRVRSWRTENSDRFRGDVHPKTSSASTNIIRSAKNNPDVDLHPGAMGPVAGMGGRWNSEENVPANIVPDAYVYS